MEERYEKEFKYLEGLRKSAIVNMYGAAPYLTKVFGYSEKVARSILREWMDRYEELSDLYGWNTDGDR